MIIEQERLKVIRALTRIEDAALIRRVHSLVAPDHQPSEAVGSNTSTEETHSGVADQVAIADAIASRQPTDLEQFGGKMEEKFDFEKLKREQPRRKHDPVAFAKLADSVEWEHTIEEMLAMLSK